MTTEQLLQHVDTAVRTVLNTKEGEVKADSTFIKDLGAESIDLLDIGCESSLVLKSTSRTSCAS